MKTVKMLLLVAVVAYVARAYGPQFNKAICEWRESLATRNFEDNTSRSTAYVIPADRWIEFEVDPSARHIRVLTNASLTYLPEDDKQPDFGRPGWRYRLDYQLVDSDGNVIQDSDYNFRATISRFRDPITREVMSPYFYSTTDYVPTSTRTLQCPLEPLGKTISRIRLKLGYHDPKISEVVCRVVNRIERPDYNDRMIWGRLSKRRREILCRASVYGPELLTPAERRSLLRWQWALAFPVIGPDDDIRRRILYRIEEIPGEELGAIDPPPGIDVNSAFDATIELPEGNGVTTIEVERVTNGFSAAAPIHVSLTHYRPSGFGQQSSEITLRQDMATKSMPVSGGYLKFESSEHVVVRAYWQDEAKLYEPFALGAAKTLRMYRLNADAVTFSIAHLEGYPSPFRAEFRLLGDDQQKSVPVTWSYVDQHGEIIRSDTLTVRPDTSRCDRTVIRSVDYNVSHPVRFYWSVPAGVSGIRFESASDVLLTGFTRPADVVRVFYPKPSAVDLAQGLEQNELDRTWFVIQPDFHEQLRTSHRSVVVKTYPTPPEDSLIHTAEYDWTSYRPEGLWRARRIVSPRDPRFPIRERAKRLVYRAFEVNRVYDVRIEGRNGDTWVAPSVVFDNNKVNAKISVKLNGEIIKEHVCRSQRGEFDLDSIRTTSHAKLEIVSDDVKPVYLNYHLAPECTPFQKRVSYRLVDGELRFSYKKETPGEEILSLRLFRSDASVRKATIEVQLPDLRMHADVPKTSWTLSAKRYEFGLSDERSSIVLDGSLEYTNEGDLAFIQLGPDVPPGNYRIHVKRMDGRDGYVVLYRTVVGSGEFREVNIIRHRLRDTVQ